MDPPPIILVRLYLHFPIAGSLFFTLGVACLLAVTETVLKKVQDAPPCVWLIFAFFLRCCLSLLPTVALSFKRSVTLTPAFHWFLTLLCPVGVT